MSPKEGFFLTLSPKFSRRVANADSGTSIGPGWTQQVLSQYIPVEITGVECLLPWLDMDQALQG